MGLLSKTLETTHRCNALTTGIERTISALRRERNESLLSDIEICIPVKTVEELKRRGLWYNTQSRRSAKASGRPQRRIE